jgi:phage N-6-adenine-methyltransferase
MPNDGMNAAGPSNDEYETPPWLFKALDTEFGFTFDAAANEANHLCDLWTGDILAAEKAGALKDQIVFCNPPYSMVEMFIKVALRSSARKWVFLIPSRTGTDWFHLLMSSQKVALRFMRKRIAFLLNGVLPLGKDGKPQGPRFDSVIAIVGSNRGGA